MFDIVPGMVVEPQINANPVAPVSPVVSPTVAVQLPTEATTVNDADAD
jgi:hypothetical protein